MENIGDLNLLQFADFSRKALVVGEMKLDIDITGANTKIAAEAPIPVYFESTTTYNVAGAANVARNLKALGIDVDLVAVMNSSDETVKEILKRDTIHPDHAILLDGYIPETVTRFFDDGFQVFQSRKPAVLVEQAYAEEAILKKCEELIATNQYAVVIVIDYDRSVISNTLARTLVNLTHFKNIPIIARPCKNEVDKFNGAAFVLVDTNAALVVRTTKEMNETVESEVYKYLNSKLSIKRASFVLSKNGISYLESGQDQFEKALFKINWNKQIVSLNKIEDAILAAIGCGVTLQLPLKQICAVAIACANYFFKENNKEIVSLVDILPNKVIQTTSDLENFVKFIPKDKKVVVTTGCFDLLHDDHVSSLRQAKVFGDFLVVLLNTDKSVKELKGPERPVYNQQERMKLVLAVTYVDFVVLFDEKVPYKQIEIINPDVFVKGEEYKEDRIMKQFPFLKQYKTTSMSGDISSTRIINRIKQNCEL